MSTPLKKVCEQLKSDKEYRQSFQANIAMQFVDATSRFKKKTGKKALSAKDIHQVANEAADEFLTVLCL